MTSWAADISYLTSKLWCSRAEHRLVEVAAHRVEPDLADDVLGEAVSEQRPRPLRREAAALQVKDLVALQLPDRRAVRALDVVGENLELRLGVDLGLGRKQEVLVELPGVGQQRPLADEDLAAEDRPRPPVEDALIELVARAVRPLVVERRVAVGVLAAGDHVEAVDRASTRSSASATFRLWRASAAPSEIAHEA